MPRALLQSETLGEPRYVVRKQGENAAGRCLKNCTFGLGSGTTRVRCLRLAAQAADKALILLTFLRGRFHNCRKMEQVASATKCARGPCNARLNFNLCVKNCAIDGHRPPRAFRAPCPAYQGQRALKALSRHRQKWSGRKHMRPAATPETERRLQFPQARPFAAAGLRAGRLSIGPDSPS